MRKLPLVIGVLAGLVLGVSDARAYSYLDFDWINTQIDTIRGNQYNSFVEGTFNIVTPDNNPVPAWAPADVGGYVTPANGGNETVTSALATFVLADYMDRGPEVEVTLGAELLGSASNWQGTIVIGPGATASLAGIIQDNGEITWRVSAVQGAFKVKYGRLDVQTKTNGVPDAGSTLGLLGFSLLGLATVSRKLRS